MKRPPSAANPTPAPSSAERQRPYHNARHLKFRQMLLTRNPMCQRLIDGQPCHNPSKILHHLISPLDRPDLQYVVSNVVLLCESCHPPTRGTPSWQVGIDFVRTIGFGEYSDA